MEISFMGKWLRVPQRRNLIRVKRAPKFPSASAGAGAKVEFPDRIGDFAREA
ncbi:MAG: hypothetical protein ACXWAC_17915 [Usitatibacter sp.]